MPDKKLTDNEIVKALECCIIDHLCNKCPLNKRRADCLKIEQYTLDLINRLQAENEEHKQRLETLMPFRIQLEASKKLEAEIKAEAYKEFAEKYKDQIKNYTGMFTDDGFMVNLEAVLSAVDFVKERLAGDNNAE